MQIIKIVVVQSPSLILLFTTPWTAAHQASLSLTFSQSLPKYMSIELMMPSNHLILCRFLLLLPSLFQHQGFFQWVGLFASGSQSIGASASASVIPMSIQGWFHLRLIGFIFFLSKGLFSLKLFYFISFYFLTLQYCIDFALHQHVSAMGVHVFPILNPPPISRPRPSLWVIPVHQPQASCILHQTWTGDSFLIWYYTCFNAILPNHPPPPSPTESKRLFCTSVSLLLSRIQACFNVHFSFYPCYVEIFVKM